MRPRLMTLLGVLFLLLFAYPALADHDDGEGQGHCPEGCEVTIINEITEVTNEVANTYRLDDDTFSRGTVIGMAIQPFLPDPGRTFRLNLGTAYYNSESAFGLTGAGRISEDVGIYIGVGTDLRGREFGGTAGVSVQW